MKNSIKQKILSYLQEHPGWVYGGLIEDFIRQTDGHKASNASRRCRELQDEGKIDRQLKDGVVQYRWVQTDSRSNYINSITFGGAPNLTGCCYSYSIFQTHDKQCPEVKKKEPQQMKF